MTVRMLPKASTVDMLPDEDMCLESRIAMLSWIGIISYDFPLAVHTSAFLVFNVCVCVSQTLFQREVNFCL